MSKFNQDKFDNQITTRASTTASRPSGAVEYSNELEEAIDTILDDIADGTSFQETIEGIYSFLQEKDFITARQWEVIKRELEKRGLHYRIDEIERLR